MILPRLTNAGVYTRAEKSTQKVHTFWVALGLKGVVRNDTYFPDGTLCSSFDCRSGKQKALLTLAAPGFRTVFEYGEDRENWVVMFVFPAIVFSESDNCFYWDYRGHRLPVPQSIELKPQEAAELRHLFATLCQFFQSTLPKNQLEAELLSLQILQYFLRTPVPADDHVELFRKKLAEDTLWEKSISEHCADMGVNRDQLRKEFFQRYKISPGEYRIQLRLRRITHLLAYSDLTLKEIAFETGMKNPSHLSSFVRARCGKTPSLLAREYRKSR
ncbi:MAG: AraC family transcriptional regulator [Lentisphaeria bacterium]|nr:AraC family transcriptional regulator [Lentisphaeria bacterium]